MNRKYRKTVIAGNWKMNKTPSETKEFMTAFKAMMPKGRWCDIALCVPAVCIPAAVRAMRETRVGIGGNADGGNTQGDITPAALGHDGLEGVHEFLGFAGGLVHLPVTSDNCLAVFSVHDCSPYYMYIDTM